VSFKVKDRGALPAFPSARCTAGIHVEQGAQERGEITVVDIGAIHEFGLGHAPERSFIRATFDDKRAALLETLRKGYKQIVKGKLTPDTVVGLAGAQYVAEVQKRIVAGIAPPNTPQTIKRKGSSTPLVDTGVLKSAITFRASE